VLVVPVGDWFCAFDPGGYIEVAEHGGCGGEAFGGELFCCGCSRSVEAVVFVELVDALDEGVRVAEVGEVVIPLVANGVNGCDEGLDVGGIDGGVDEGGLELAVDGVFGGVAVGIFFRGPAVVVDGDVERLRAIGDVVAEPSGVEEDGGFDGLGVLMLGGELAVVAHGGLEALPDLTGDVRLEAYTFGAELGGEVGVGGGVGVEGGDVLVALAGQGSDEVGVFDVDEVVGSLSGDELGFGAGTPAVGLGAEPGDFIDGFGSAKESGHVGGEGFGGEAVDHGVAFAAPAEGGRNSEETEDRNEERAQEFHVGMSIKGERKASAMDRFGRLMKRVGYPRQVVDVDSAWFVCIDRLDNMQVVGHRLVGDGRVRYRDGRVCCDTAVFVTIAAVMRVVDGRRVRRDSSEVVTSLDVFDGQSAESSSGAGGCITEAAEKLVPFDSGRGAASVRAGSRASRHAAGDDASQAWWPHGYLFPLQKQKRPLRAAFLFFYSIYSGYHTGGITTPKFFELVGV
jgi:hypothetical protein